tara:strand:+ start:1491 stop:1679 length:189 start_codon:yes stop_codon:yes gene_type:complete
MWVAIVIACSTPLAESCQVFANKDRVFYSESTCKDDSYKMIGYLLSQGIFAKDGCMKIGESA